MKQSLRKLLSLVLVASMLCSVLVIQAGAKTEGTIAAETVTVYLLGKDGETKTIATYSADKENDTYVDNNETELPGVVTVQSFYNGSLGTKNYILYTGSDRGNFARGPVVTKYVELATFAEMLTANAYDPDTWLIKMATAGDSWVTYYGEPVAGRTDIIDSSAKLYASYDWLKATIANGYVGSSELLVDKYSDKYVVPTVLAICSYNERLRETSPTVDGLEEWADNLADSNDMKNALRLFSGMELDNTSGQYLNTGANSQKGVSEITLEPTYYAITVNSGSATGTEGEGGYSVMTGNAVVTTGDNWFKASKGETVTLTVTSADGYQVESVKVSGAAVTDNGDSTYSFTMPGQAVDVSVTTTAAGGEGTNVIYGDINNDGDITVVDAIMLYDFINEKLELSETQKLAANVNGDGDITVVDAIILYDYINEKISVFPVESNA